MGAFLEYCYVGTLPFSGASQKTMAYYAQRMKAVGPAHAIMSTDLGNAVNPVHTAGLRSYIQALLKEGLTQDEIDQMVRKNPAYLLGLK
jgi:predicted metal-dependent phosphotriesterase family hydrolase